MNTGGLPGGLGVPKCDKRAVVGATPSASRLDGHGASLRLRTIVGILEEAGWRVDLLAGTDSTSHDRVCLGVAVSYAAIPTLRGLRAKAPHLWLDATDSWLLTDVSGIRAGHPSYAARFVRDAFRVSTMPKVDVATWICDADRRLDRMTVRARQRFVLPPAAPNPSLEPADTALRRVVLAGDWDYAPNRDGARWFADRVLPLLECELPTLGWQVYVYGRGATGVAKRARWIEQGWTADTRQLYQANDVHVAPVRFGAGVKNKVVQPLLAGLPVVTTPSGAHGLAQHPLLDVREGAEAFAKALTGRLAAPSGGRPARPSEIYDGDDRARLLGWLDEIATTCRL